VNNQIRASKVRLIDEKGQNQGVVELHVAIGTAIEKGLDLIEIAPTAEPPVAKIADFGKYLYQLEKEERKQKAKQKVGGLKVVKIGLSTSEHDSATKIKQLERFLGEGHKVKIEMFLRGRERANKAFAEERFAAFMTRITAEHKVEQTTKKLPTGFLAVISR